MDSKRSHIREHHFSLKIFRSGKTCPVIIESQGKIVCTFHITHYPAPFIFIFCAFRAGDDRAGVPRIVLARCISLIIRRKCDFCGTCHLEYMIFMSANRVFIKSNESILFLDIKALVCIKVIQSKVGTEVCFFIRSHRTVGLISCGYQPLKAAGHVP